MTNSQPPTTDADFARPPAAKVKRLYRLQNTTLMKRMMPQLQHRLLDLVRRWGSGEDDILLSEREVKVMTHLIGVLEKIIAVEERSKAMDAQKIVTEQNEADIDLEPLRAALAARLQTIIDARTPSDFPAEFE